MMMDNDSPKALGFLQAYSRGLADYSQSGDLIPDLRLQNKYAQEFAGPLVGETLISGTPSFEVPPDIDSPVVDRWIENRRKDPNFRQNTIQEVRDRMPAIRQRLGLV